MRRRESGISSIREMKTFYYMLKVTSAILLHQLHRPVKHEDRIA
jgi:hypothetical protein